MGYRLGLDLGANSIGWCALRLDAERTPDALIDMGVRVYPDGRNPKDNTSLAADRRLPRAMRRNRDRYLQRRTVLLNALTRYGLMPEDAGQRGEVAKIDPYRLRAEALHGKLEPFELGRVLFHLNQSRGFKSNRKVDRSTNEAGPIKVAAEATREELRRSGHATYGSWLAERHAAGGTVRVRLAGSGKTAAYPFYPMRAMIEDEFDTIWAAQAGWNQALTEDMGRALRDIIFHQRKLKPVPVGKCWLEHGEPRAPRALPTAQRFRIAQTVAHLRVSQTGMPESALDDRQRRLLLALLYEGKDQSLDQVRTKLGLPPETDFNTRDDTIKGCGTSSRLGAKTVFGKAWHELDLASQDSAVQALLDSESDEAAVASLTALGLPKEGAVRSLKIGLPDGHASLSAKAICKILTHLEAGHRYSDAVQLAEYIHHSDTRTGEIRDRLPYYGELLRDRIGTGTGEETDPEEKRLGKAPNPTVHVALNELRRVVNAMIDRLGPPDEIVVETLRDLGRSKKQREAYEAEQKKNREANDRRRAMLAEMGERDNSRNRMRLRLWEEQASDPKQRVCPYTGTLITCRTALTDAVEEDHILPFALTLDDSAANRMLVTREANRAKARKSPYDAFGHTKEWEAIAERAKQLPGNKKWRFQPDALAKFAKDGDFLARHLTDSATIARWATMYLEVLAPGKVWSVPGRLTALLRDGLGLNSDSVLGKGGARKDRNDHRHHAIDAVVVALTDRGMLKRVTDAAKRADLRGERLLVEMEPPWEGFVADVAARARAVTVSHKPDTGWQAALHNDTAYGMIKGASAKAPNVVVRRPLLALAEWSADEARAGVRDSVLAGRIGSILSLPDVAARKVGLAALTHSGKHIVRRVRTVERLDSVQPIGDRRTGVPYKAVKRDGNHRSEVWLLPDGKLQMTVVSYFDAARDAEAIRLGRTPPDRRPHPAAKLKLKLHKNDLIAVKDGEGRRILCLREITEGRLKFADHNEAGNLRARHGDERDPFRWSYKVASRLKLDGARKVRVLPDGRIYDPGPVL
jgi:CRISPR-associated endonuclease Csn1